MTQVSTEQREATVELLVEAEPSRRSRVTVAFRLILAIPHMFVLAVVSIAAFVVSLVGWFAALFTGRLPEGMWRFLSRYLGYWTRVTAYVWLMTDRYPRFGFDDDAYPVQVRATPTRLSRLAVAFRLVLMIPAVIANSVAGGAVVVLGVLTWFAIVLTGRRPRAFVSVMAVLMRYQVRFTAYMLLVTPVYAWGLFGERATGAPQQPSAPPAEGAPGAEVAAAGEVVPDIAEVPPAEAERFDRAMFALWPGALGLLIVMLVVGVLFNGASYAMQLGGVQRSLALNAVGEASQRFAGEVAAAGDVSRCESDPQPLSCLRTIQGAQAAAVQSFLQELRQIAYPADAVDEWERLGSTGVLFLQALTQLSEVRGFEEYIQLAGELELPQLGTRFDEELEDLARALGAQ